MNAEETGEFVVNMVAGTLSEKTNITTAMVAYGVDEMKLAGLLGLQEIEIGLNRRIEHRPSQSITVEPDGLDTVFGRMNHDLPQVDL